MRFFRGAAFAASERRSDSSVPRQGQMLFHIPDELTAASGQLAHDAVDPLLGRVPVVLGDVEAMNRAYPELSLGESHLVEHQASPRVERFADNQGLFD